jgi:PKD repeat protein
MTDLNESIAGLPEAAGWILTDARAINDQGDIVGTGLKNGVSHGYVLFSGRTGGMQNQPPVAVVTSDVSSGRAPLTVHFDGSASSDLEGAISYAWDFGDGSPLASEIYPTNTSCKPGYTS